MLIFFMDRQFSHIKIPWFAYVLCWKRRNNNFSFTQHNSCQLRSINLSLTRSKISPECFIIVWRHKRPCHSADVGVMHFNFHLANALPKFFHHWWNPTHACLIANAWAKQGGAKNSVTSGDNLLSQSMVLKNYDNFSDLLGFLMIFISFMWSSRSYSWMICDMYIWQI